MLSFQHLINIKSYLDILRFGLLHLVFKTSLYFYTYSTSQFTLTVFPLPSSQIQVVATVLMQF